MRKTGAMVSPLYTDGTLMLIVIMIMRKSIPNLPGAIGAALLELQDVAQTSFG
jgi:hypothetical protein